MKRVLFTFAGLVFTFLALPMLSNSPSSALSAMPGPRAYKLYCASDDFYRHFCPISTYGGVELVRQKSESACIYGRTWGVTGDSIWVDRGCRADFAVGTGEYFRDGDYRGGRTFYCASDDFNLHGCPVDTYGGVRLVRQRSESPCIYGRTWGYDGRGVWVDRGCRADFAVGYRRDHDRDDRDDDRDDRRH
jgi:hypothetical protein